MWLIFTENNDPSGAWLAQGLAQRGFADVLQISRRDLGQLKSWDFGSDAQGSWFQLELANGRRIDSRVAAGVVNRLQPVAAEQSWHENLGGLGSPEMASALRACLASFSCPVINPVDVRSMHGGARPASEWPQLARQAGLPALTQRAVMRGGNQLHYSDAGFAADAARMSSGKVLVIGRRVVSMALSPDAPEAIAAGCVKLAELALTPLLEVTFFVSEAGEWFFRGANSCPNLSPGGNGVLDAMAESLLLNSAIIERLEVT